VPIYRTDRWLEVIEPRLAVPSHLPVPAEFRPDLTADERESAWSRRVAIVHYSQEENGR
jgi:hypothetical protein